MPEQRIELLRGHRRRGQCHIDADGTGGAHGVRGVADEHQAITRPIFDQDDFPFEWEERLKVAEIISESRKHWVQATHALGLCGIAGFPQVTPLACREKQASLNVVGVFGEYQAPHLRSQREIHRIRPVWRLLNDKPDDIKVVMLVVNVETTQPPYCRVASVGAHDDIGPDLKRFLAVAGPPYTYDSTLFLDEFSRPGSHPALKAAEGGGFLHQRLQEDGLRDPDGIGILRHDGVEGKS